MCTIQVIKVTVNQLETADRLDLFQWKTEKKNKKRYSQKQCKYLILNELKRWAGTELTRRHEDFQSSALPTELPSQVFQKSLEAKEDKYHNH